MNIQATIDELKKEHDLLLDRSCLIMDLICNVTDAFPEARKDVRTHPVSKGLCDKHKEIETKRKGIFKAIEALEAIL
jgi:hypothetical protein